MMDFLYRSTAGRILLKALVWPPTSKATGYFLDKPESRALIPWFIRTHRVDLSEVRADDWSNFNQFFSRRLVEGARPADGDPDALIAPCDGLLHALRMEQGRIITVKEVGYTAGDLLRSARLPAVFQDGTCLVFRLTPSDYHRYIYPDGGHQIFTRHIPGVLHTVRPVATEATDVYVQNSRDYSLILTEHFGPMIYMEVGAMLVGRITNLHSGDYICTRGEEKGYFEYNGSTIILLLKKDRVTLRQDIIDASLAGREITVRSGERIGTRRN